MKLFEVIKQTKWDNVMKHLYIYCDSDVAALFHKIYEKLYILPPITQTNEKIFITVDYISHENKYDTYGSKTTDNYKYILSLSTWEEWLGFYLSSSTLDKMSADEIVAHCMWEMTYYGTTSEEVKINRDSLMQATKLTDKKTYTEEKIICPFCDGEKVQEGKQPCSHCNGEGTIRAVYSS
ncbi:hypothetical protein CN918_32415 [Priestia megaterium]|nr:hypothetical protein CN918_32415 [Priestia megaterium]